MNICQCGTLAGYQHPQGCPFPYYGNTADRVRGWQLAAADVMQATEAVEMMPDGRCPRCLDTARDCVCEWGAA